MVEYTMENARKVFIIFLLISLFPLYSAHGIEPGNFLSWETLDEKFGELYPCLRTKGLVTFSALISSDQLKMLAQSVHVSEPILKLVYQKKNKFSVTIQTKQEQDGSTKEMVANMADAIKSSVEGFFQGYESIAFSNLFDGISASSTITIATPSLIVEFTDKNPHHFVKLLFDRDFRLTLLELADKDQNAKTVISPTWRKINNKFILVAMENEYFQNGVSVFLSKMRIENARIGPFLLPVQVAIQARDGGVESPNKAVIDFHVNSYELGIQPDTDQ